MTQQAGKIVAVVAGLLTLWGCHGSPLPSTELVQINAKVVSVGKTHLLLDDGKSVMFVTIDQEDKERLKKLQKDEKVIIVGKRSEDPKDDSIEVQELIVTDGTHIPLGG